MFILRIDRKIPFDSDSVEITRELSPDGENVYYINKKKTQRMHVVDLLEMANAGLHQLNAVQQGTVTRISEFTAEEKRRAIEDLVGMSLMTFDEKKLAAQKQLDLITLNIFCQALNPQSVFLSAPLWQRLC